MPCRFWLDTNGSVKYISSRPVFFINDLYFAYRIITQRRYIEYLAAFLQGFDRRAIPVYHYLAFFRQALYTVHIEIAFIVFIGKVPADIS